MVDLLTETVVSLTTVIAMNIAPVPDVASDVFPAFAARKTALDPFFAYQAGVSDWSRVAGSLLIIALRATAGFLGLAVVAVRRLLDVAAIFLAHGLGGSG